MHNWQVGKKGGAAEPGRRPQGDTEVRREASCEALELEAVTAWRSASRSPSESDDSALQAGGRGDRRACRGGEGMASCIPRRALPPAAS